MIFGQRAMRDVEALLVDVDRLQAEVNLYLPIVAAAEILKADCQRQREGLRSALQSVVGACRFDCTPESNCGICAIALRALEEVQP